MKRVEDIFIFENDERSKFQEVFLNAMDKMSIDVRNGDEYENDIFEVIPYNWNDEEDGYFIFKPSYFEFSFYKYPMRAAELSKKIKLNKFIQIMEICKASYGL